MWTNPSAKTEARALQDEIEAIPNVSSVTFVTKEQALQDFIAQQETAELFENTSAETLRDRYRIHVENIEQLQDTADQVKQVNGIADVEASLEIADGFVMVRNVATAIAVILIVMLVVISVFIIANTIKLSTFTRREEIAIMKMCGATNWFVRAPFLVEGVMLGLAGGIIAFFCQWGIYGLITRAMMESGIFSIITTVPFGNISHVVFAGVPVGWLRHRRRRFGDGHPEVPESVNPGKRGARREQTEEILGPVSPPAARHGGDCGGPVYFPRPFPGGWSAGLLIGQTD